MSSAWYSSKHVKSLKLTDPSMVRAPIVLARSSMEDCMLACGEVAGGVPAAEEGQLETPAGASMRRAVYAELACLRECCNVERDHENREKRRNHEEATRRVDGAA